MNEISFVAWNKATVDDDDEGESQPRRVESKRLAGCCWLAHPHSALLHDPTAARFPSSCQVMSN